MADKIRVLVFPAGEVNSIELHDALATTVNVELYGGSSVDRHGPYIFRNYISGIPLISDAAFVDRFNEIIRQYAIDVVFPTHDTVVTFLAEHSSKIDAKIAVSDKRTADICRDKKLTYDLFAGEDFLPKLFATAGSVDSFPVFAKPRIGQGSVGAHKVADAAGLEHIDFEESVVAEFLEGREYTVDCLTDGKGVLKAVSPRTRERTLAGITVAGRTVPLTDEVRRIAERINEKLDFTGLWFFQLREDAEGRPKLLEVSARCAGTMCLTRARGINLPLLTVYALMGYDVEAAPNEGEVVVDRTLINRYRTDYEYDRVYFDFDDTLIIDGRVHLYAIMFLYQCRNAGKHITLLTKHAEEIYDSLDRHHIDKGIFDEIVHIRDEDAKIDSIKPDKAIFVDNAYQERKQVQAAYGMPVYDVDGLEVLLDWRT